MPNDNRDEVWFGDCGLEGFRDPERVSRKPKAIADNRSWATRGSLAEDLTRLSRTACFDEVQCKAGLQALDRIRLVSIDKTKHQPKESAMFEAKHTDREGRTMLIAQMTDDHLRNTCNLAFKSITDVWASAAPPTGDAVERALYRNETVSAKQAAQVIRQLVEGLTPYLLEAMLRPSVSETIANGWRQAMKREQARPAAPTVDFCIPIRIQP